LDEYYNNNWILARKSESFRTKALSYEIQSIFLIIFMTLFA
jgi:hypothetical protein